MVNPYQPPASAGPTGDKDYSLLKRILAVPLAGVSAITALLALLTLAGLLMGVLQGRGSAWIGSLFSLAFVAGISAGSFALARAFWNPARYSRAAIEKASLRALYEEEKLDQHPGGDPGLYAETQDGELVRLHARVRADRLPQRHRELLARIKQRVEELGPL